MAKKKAIQGSSEETRRPAQESKDREEAGQDDYLPKEQEHEKKDTSCDD